MHRLFIIDTDDAWECHSQFSNAAVDEIKRYDTLWNSEIEQAIRDAELMYLSH